MISFVLLWAVILGIALFAYITFPLFSKRNTFPEIDPAETLMQTLALEREQSYSALVDLDEDYESGKLSEKDYTELRAELLQETVNVVSRLEAAAQTDVEAEIERYKKQKRE